MGAYVDLATADALERSLDQGGDGSFALEADDGRYTIALRRGVYVKRFTRDGRGGFSPGGSAFAVGSAGASLVGDLQRRRPHRRSPPSGRARPTGRPGGARGPVPAAFRPHLQLPPHERRQPARRGGPDDADLPEDARGNRALPLAFGAVLGVALPDR